MRKWILSLIVGAGLAMPAMAAERELDPIFQNTGVQGQPSAECFNRDNRNAIVKGATSTAGQTIIGGLVGAVAGDQIGSGSGNDIATGVGAAAGAATGAWNANRMENQRIRECQQVQDYAGQRDGGGRGQRVRY